MKKGIATIELTLLMPILLGIILMIMTLTFELYDRVVLEWAVGTAVLDGMKIENPVSARELIQTEIEFAIDHQMIKSKPYQHKVMVTNDEIQITVNDGKNKLISKQIDRENETAYILSKRKQGAGYCLGNIMTGN